MSDQDKEADDFFLLLNSISSEISHRILNLYSKEIKGLNLTETSNNIGEKTSTVRDNLNKLLTTNLIYKKEKNYFLSNFGSFVLHYMKHLEIFNKTRQVFGQIPAELIPFEFIQELVPHISDIEIQSDQWKFMTISTRIMKKIVSDLNTEPGRLRVIGWESLTKALEIMDTFFKTKPINEFLHAIDFQLISPKVILNDIRKQSNIKKIAQLAGERIHICEEIENFKFILFNYNDIVQFFLSEGGNVGMGYHFVLEDNPEAVKFFDNVFDYYLKKSKPLFQYL